MRDAGGRVERFFRMSRSIFTRASSVRSRPISFCSALTALPTF